MRRAVIVGAGVAGLATALRLGRDGWDTVVVERAPQRRTGGYVVNLLGPGYDAAEGLGLLPALAEGGLGDGGRHGQLRPPVGVDQHGGEGTEGASGERGQQAEAFGGVVPGAEQVHHVTAGAPLWGSRPRRRLPHAASRPPPDQNEQLLKLV